MQHHQKPCVITASRCPAGRALSPACNSSSRQAMLNAADSQMAQINSGVSQGRLPGNVVQRWSSAKQSHNPTGSVLQAANTKNSYTSKGVLQKAKPSPTSNRPLRHHTQRQEQQHHRRKSGPPTSSER
ncbi:MAG: hypothetical protein GPOALKHO_000818 [Sodalis sp.]|nr:MAG: hypothetical protein GPOALKHO_000818 [Sodalis sp.]